MADSDANPAGRGRAAAPPVRVSLIVLNWDGLRLGVLPHTLAALDRHYGARADCEIILADNGSADGSTAWTRWEYPRLRVIELGANLGFGRGNNAAARAARGDYLWFLNDDVEVSAAALDGLLAHFRDPSVFAAAPALVRPDGAQCEGHSWGELRDGRLLLHNERNSPAADRVRVPLPTVYAVGAALLCDARKFRQLGGFDPLYAPYYWEDNDLGLRAWRRGWRSVYDPRFTMIHRDAVSARSLPHPERVARIRERNYRLCQLRHVSPGADRFRLIWSLTGELLRTRESRAAATAGLAVRLPGVFWRRLINCRHERAAVRDGLREIRRARRRALDVDRPGDRPRVLWIVPYLPWPLEAGGRVRLYNLLTRLSRRCELHLLSLIETGAETRHLAHLAPHCRSLRTIVRIPSPPPLRQRLLRPGTVRGFHVPALTDAIRETLTRERFDLVQIEFSIAGQYLAAVEGVPTIYTEHDAGTLIPGQSYERLPFGRRWLAWLRHIDYTRELLGLADRVVTLSAADRDLLRVLDPDAEYSVIPTGTDPVHFDGAFNETDGQRVVFVGHMAHYPNLDAVRWFHREIHPRLKARVPGYAWDIVGSALPPEVLELETDPRITVHPDVPDVRPVLAEAQVFVAPVRLGRGFKGKVVEAMAMRLPVVATPGASRGLTARPGEELLVAADPSAFADAVERLLRDPAERRRLALNGRRLVERDYSWDRLADRLWTVYREVISGAPPSA